MVNGAWPVKQENYSLWMPTYHLAFCLAVLEFDPLLTGDPVVVQVVYNSMDYWFKNYYQNGLVAGMPGWYFVDWSNEDESLSKQVNIAIVVPHSICNAWWHELCQKVKKIRPEVESYDISIKSFNNTFQRDQGYSLYSQQSSISYHATVIAVASGLIEPNKDINNYLTRVSFGQRINQIVTAYFAYFVAKALQKISQTVAINFIRVYYDPIVERYGTIYEKCNGNASLAHGWSVGIVDIWCNSVKENLDSPQILNIPEILSDLLLTSASLSEDQSQKPPNNSISSTPNKPNPQKSQKKKDRAQASGWSQNKKLD